MLVQVHFLDPYKHFRPFLLAPVHVLDLYEHVKKRKESAFYPDDNQKIYKKLSDDQKLTIVSSALDNLLNLFEAALYTRVRNTPLEYDKSII